MRVKRHILDYIRRAIREMNYDSPLYKMLKQELTRLGYWRNRPRGKGSAEHFRGKQ